jgi:hypothetical protein
VEDEVIVFRRKEQMLATPLSAGEAPALERRQRRVESLQSGDVRRPGSLDACTSHRLVERAPCRLDLGKLGNDASSWMRSE